MHSSWFIESTASGQLPSPHAFENEQVQAGDTDQVSPRFTASVHGSSSFSLSRPQGCSLASR